MRIHSVPNQCDLVAKTQSCFIVTVHPPLELKPIIKMHRGNPMEVKKVIIQLSNRNWISLPTKLSAHCINSILDFPKSVLSFRQNICEWHPVINHAYQFAQCVFLMSRSPPIDLLENSPLTHSELWCGLEFQGLLIRRMIRTVKIGGTYLAKI